MKGREVQLIPMSFARSVQGISEADHCRHAVKGTARLGDIELQSSVVSRSHGP